MNQNKTIEYANSLKKLKLRAADNTTLDSIINNNDIVVVSPIRTNNLNVHRICTDCSRIKVILQDCAFYAKIIQTFFTILIFLLICMNVQRVYRFYQECDDDVCPLKKCHLIFIATSLAFVTFLTMIIVSYDRKQSKNDGYRPNPEFFIFLMWSGGWIVGWMLLFRNKMSNNFRDIFFKYGILISLISIVTLGGFYIFVKSYYF